MVLQQRGSIISTERARAFGRYHIACSGVLHVVERQNATRLRTDGTEPVQLLIQNPTELDVSNITPLLHLFSFLSAIVINIHHATYTHDAKKLTPRHNETRRICLINKQCIADYTPAANAETKVSDLEIIIYHRC